MKALRIPPIYKCIGLCDADLLDNGTRHPNLVLMKIAGFLFDNHIPFELILERRVHKGIHKRAGRVHKRVHKSKSSDI